MSIVLAQMSPTRHKIILRQYAKEDLQMEIDPQKITRILQMNEKDFSDFIYAVVLSAGADRSRAEMARSFAPLIRQKLQNTDAKELHKLIESVGEEKVKRILDSLAP